MSITKPIIESTLRSALEAGGYHYADTQVVQLLNYLDLLHRWNQTYNLTAIREPQDMLHKHIFDSLSVLPYVHGPNLADLGSGAGLPGIPVAIMRTDIDVTLVESNGKKARFLRECVRTLSLPNVRVDETRAEQGASNQQRFAQVIARALTALPDLAQYASHWMQADGELLAMKGPDVGAEIKILPEPFFIKENHRLKVPMTSNIERFLVVVGMRLVQ